MEKTEEEIIEIKSMSEDVAERRAEMEEEDEDIIPHRASDNAAYDKIDGLDQDKD